MSAFKAAPRLGLQALRHPVIPRLIAIVLIVLAVWALSGFFGVQTGARIGLVLGVLVLWLGGEAALRFMRRRAAASLLDEIAEPGEADVLKDKFEEAIGRLKSAPGGGAGLLDLPWYVIIGPPGSGKSTALRNAGLKFPLEQSYGEASLKGVGGTRDCDWWFTDQAVLLDTAGRYTTQDSDPGGDHAAWTAFLELLMKHRPRRPLNGVLIAIGADILLESDARARSAHADAVRRRVQEIQTHLKLRLPIYVLVTKMDLVAGFSEVFELLTPEERAQVWGYTRQDLELDPARDPGPSASFDASFDALVKRLSGETLDLVHDERDLKRRALIFGFPQQVAGLKEPLSAFLDEAFSPGTFSETPLVRGFYLTSGVQEGAPIDRLIGSMGRALGLGAADAERRPAQSRSYFIRDALQRVAFPEQDLLGLRRKEEVRLAMIRRAALGGSAATVAVALLGWTIGLTSNAGAFRDVERVLEGYKEEFPNALQFTGRFGPDATAALSRLDRLAQAEETATERAPTFGLVGAGLARKAPEDAYRGALDRMLTPLVKERFETRLFRKDTVLDAFPADGSVFKIYDDIDLLPHLLKSYAMLAAPGQRIRGEDAALFRQMADFAWFSESADLRGRGATHLEAWLELGRGPVDVDLDADVLQAARTALLSNPDRLDPARLAYALWKFDGLAQASAGAEESRLRFDLVTGVGRSDTLLVRRSGGPLQAVIPQIYTREGFEAFVAAGGARRALRDMQADAFAYGPSVESFEPVDEAALTEKMIDLYVDDYIEFWTFALEDVGVWRRDGFEGLKWLARPNSPLERFLVLVHQNTDLTPPQNAAEAAVDTSRSLFGQPATPSGPDADSPFARVANEFAPLKSLMEGEGDERAFAQFLEDMKIIDRHVTELNTGRVDDLPPPATQAISRMRGAAASLDDPATKGLSNVIDEIAKTAESDSESSRFDNVRDAWAREYARECRTLTLNKFPFSRNARNAIPLGDFQRLFAPAGFGGRLMTFVDEELAPLIDDTGSTWVWKDASRGDPNVLRQFQAAREICEMFFAGCAGPLGVSFAVEPVDTHPDVATAILVAGGKEIVFRQTQTEETRGLRWPSDTPSRLSLTSLSGAAETLPADDEWHLFRMLSQRGGRVTGGALTIALSTETLWASYRFRPSSSVNPFTTLRSWPNFRCPEALE
ncbi:MAG: type VI secretion system membrane subunit TssM [Pseudomonadota bacterium]